MKNKQRPNTSEQIKKHDKAFTAGYKAGFKHGEALGKFQGKKDAFDTVLRLVKKEREDKYELEQDILS